MILKHISIMEIVIHSYIFSTLKCHFEETYLNKPTVRARATGHRWANFEGSCKTSVITTISFVNTGALKIFITA